jgi:hypothetical protein
MSEPASQNFPQNEGIGCGLLAIAGGVILASGLLYGLYVMGGFGSPEIQNFRDQCRQRKMRKPGHPDYDHIILQCERELREFLSHR